MVEDTAIVTVLGQASSQIDFCYAKAKRWSRSKPSPSRNNMAQPTRCGWAGPEPIYLDYHDHEWGRPTHDDRALFELLSLEGMQAGLSWITILKKREAFRAVLA